MNVRVLNKELFNGTTPIQQQRKSDENCHLLHKSGANFVLLVFLVEQFAVGKWRGSFSGVVGKVCHWCRASATDYTGYFFCIRNSSNNFHKRRHTMKRKKIEKLQHTSDAEGQKQVNRIGKVVWFHSLVGFCSALL